VLYKIWKSNLLFTMLINFYFKLMKIFVLNLILFSLEIFN